MKKLLLALLIFSGLSLSAQRWSSLPSATSIPDSSLFCISFWDSTDNYTSKSITYNFLRDSINSFIASYWSKTGGQVTPLTATDTVNTETFYMIDGENAISFPNGFSNIAIGKEAGINSIGGANIFLGYEAGKVNDVGANNVYIGYQSGYSADNSTNTYIGFQSGYNSTGGGNTFLGYLAGYNETGSNKLCIENSNSTTPLIWGDFAKDKLIFNCNVDSAQLSSQPTGSTDLAIATTKYVDDNVVDSSLWSETGNYLYPKNITDSVGIGTATPSYKLDVNGIINTSESYKIDGYNALSFPTSLVSYSNIAIGKDAGRIQEDNSYRNLVIGNESGYNMDLGQDNILLGYKSGYSLTDGAKNVFIGVSSGYSNTTESSNIFIGYKSGYNETNSNRLYIESSNSTTPLIGGDFNLDVVGVNMLIASIDSTLTVGGGGHFTGGLLVDGSVTIDGDTLKAKTLDIENDTTLEDVLTNLPDYNISTVDTLTFKNGATIINDETDTLRINEEVVQIDSTLLANRVLVNNIYHVYGGFQDSSVTIALTQNNWGQVTNATNTLFTGIEADGITLSGDTMTFANSGDYAGNVTITMSGSNNDECYIGVYNVTQSYRPFYIGFTGVSATSFENVCLPLYLEVTSGDRYVLQVLNTDSNDDIIARTSIFYISYLHE